MPSVFLNHHDFEPVSAFVQHYAFRAVRSDLFGPAKKNHAFTPPIAQTRFHSAVLTG